MGTTKAGIFEAIIIGLVEVLTISRVFEARKIITKRVKFFFKEM